MCVLYLQRQHAGTITCDFFSRIPIKTINADTNDDDKSCYKYQKLMVTTTACSGRRTGKNCQAHKNTKKTCVSFIPFEEGPVSNCTVLLCAFLLIAHSSKPRRDGTASTTRGVMSQHGGTITLSGCESIGRVAQDSRLRRTDLRLSRKRYKVYPSSVTHSNRTVQSMKY